jgi:hypothetical protein
MAAAARGAAGATRTEQAEAGRSNDAIERELRIGGELYDVRDSKQVVP